MTMYDYYMCICTYKKWVNVAHVSSKIQVLQTYIRKLKTTVSLPQRFITKEHVCIIAYIRMRLT